MKTYTDTERLDFLLYLIETQDTAQIFNQLEIGRSIDRHAVDATIRNRIDQVTAARAEKLNDLKAQIAQLQRQITAIESNPLEIYRHSK